MNTPAENEESKVLEGEIVEKNAVIAFSPNLPVTRAALNTVAESRKLLHEFVQSQMRPNIDYGTVAGDRPSLLKPGAEKLCKLFNLRIRTELVEKTIDLHGNFALFIYRATVMGPNGQELAQVEASCNSQEKKYKSRRAYDRGDGKSFHEEDTPIADILNTLMKMAQKRAKVGGVVEAVGASDFYTQDIDDPEDAEQLGIRQPTKRAEVRVPKASNARSESTVQTCDCGNQMMISKYGEEPRPWYCGKCKSTKPR